MNTPKNTVPRLWTRSFIEITVINFVVFFSFQMIFPILPLYIKHLGGTDSIIGFIIGAFTFSTMLTRPLVGYLLDTISKKSILILGLVFFSLIITSYRFAHSIGMILFLRILHGIGWGFTGTATATIASEMIPKKRFGEGMGYFSLANTLAMSIAPAAGIALGTLFDYQDVFMLGGLIAACGICFSLFLQADHKHGKTTQSFSAHQPYEKSAIKPALLLFFVTITYGGVISFLPLYAYSMGIRHIGAFFIVYSLAILITRPQVGKIIDRYGFNITLIPGFICLLIGILMLSFVHTLGCLLLVGVIYGVGFGTLQTSLQTMAVRDVPFERLGAANATLYTGSDIGIGLGVMALGTIAEHFGYDTMYLFTTVPIIAGLLFYILSEKLRHQNR